MPQWIFWTFVGAAVWVAVSIVLAFAVGHVLGRRPTAESRRRVVVLAGPTSVRVRQRGRGRGLRKVG